MRCHFDGAEETGIEMHSARLSEQAIESRRDVSSQIFQKIWQDGNYAFASDTFTEDCVHHFYDRIQATRIPGPCGYIWMVESFRNALTNLQVHYDLEPSGEVVHWSVGGLGVRPLLDVSLPAKRLELAGNEFFRFSGEKIAETWSVWNIQGCLKRVAAR